MQYLIPLQCRARSGLPLFVGAAARDIDIRVNIWLDVISEEAKLRVELILVHRMKRCTITFGRPVPCASADVCRAGSRCAPLEQLQSTRCSGNVSFVAQTLVLSSFGCTVDEPRVSSCIDLSTTAGKCHFACVHHTT